MIEIKVKELGGEVIGFELSGHAGGGVRGSNIVCAGVSALSQSLVLGFVKVLNLKELDMEVSEGYLRCNFGKYRGDFVWDKIEVLSSSFLLSVKELERQYRNEIKISYKRD